MNTNLFPEPLLERIRDCGVVATIVVEAADQAVPLAEALARGGVSVLELTLRTPVALEALRRIRGELPELLVGAGTVLRPSQITECLEAGAAFGVAPGMNPRVVREACERGLPFAPGVCTPSDIEQALENGCTFLKFFPSEPSGGLPYLRSIAAPYRHLGVRFLPLGGIDASNAAAYLSDPLVPALGGSWLAPQKLLNAGNWDAITALAHQASTLVAQVRGIAGSDRT